MRGDKDSHIHQGNAVGDRDWVETCQEGLVRHINSVATLRQLDAGVRDAPRKSPNRLLALSLNNKLVQNAKPKATSCTDRR